LKGKIILYLGFSQVEKQNVRMFHDFFRDTDTCRLDRTQVKSSPAFCVREWPAPDAAEEGTRQFVEAVLLHVGETSS